MGLYGWYTCHRDKHNIMDTWYKCESSVPCLVPGETKEMKGRRCKGMDGYLYQMLGSFFTQGLTETSSCLLRVQRWTPLRNSSWWSILASSPKWTHLSQNERISLTWTYLSQSKWIFHKWTSLKVNVSLSKWMCLSQSKQISHKWTLFSQSEYISLKMNTSLSKWTNLSQITISLSK